MSEFQCRASRVDRRFVAGSVLATVHGVLALGVGCWYGQRLVESLTRGELLWPIALLVVPPAFAAGLVLLRGSTHAVMWWSAWVVIALAFAYVLLLVISVILLGAAIAADGLIT
jgi:hypothetical protein